MALQLVKLNELKAKESQLKSAKNEYEEIVRYLKNTIKSTADSWTDRDGEDFRDKLIRLIDSDLKTASDEIDFEIKYLRKISTVLENAQKEVRNRLNR